ncbi:gamma-glutamylcyclotransferase family protein [Streptomyces violaceusniger]|uniref:gamma-glutamylcyclotransferase family protein n=1 Tax=Streptomyces violaceusniger TaxID=68280 RepID=UPI0001E4B206|nr:gamma-glutamylcyclotransferase family protein [Streptomyces violaceusniger]
MVVVSPAPEDTVEGQVFTISDAELAMADAYEGDDYARGTVTLRRDPVRGRIWGARATRPATRLSRCPANTVAGWMRTMVPGSL